MFDMHKTDLVPSSEPQKLSALFEENSDAKRGEFGVEGGLNDIPGVTTLMLVAFGEHGIKTIEDLADCATDDLSLIHISEPTRLGMISYAVFCLKKKKKK